uniref:H15 domain-containing protein n=1 Tax=Clastoptera arizonana TaxID=38151 RepID=A0A1B6CWP6_9HEMI
MDNPKLLVQAVCSAVKQLEESNGADVEQILAYLQSTMDVEDMNSSNVRLAVEKALKKNLLVETSDGKYKLNVDMTKQQLAGMNDLGEMEAADSCGSCPKRSSRRRSRKCGSRRRKVCRRAKSGSVTSLKRLLRKLRNKRCKSGCAKKRTRTCRPKRSCRSKRRCRRSSKIRRCDNDTSNTQISESEEKPVIIKSSTAISNDNN